MADVIEIEDKVENQAESTECTELVTDNNSDNPENPEMTQKQEDGEVDSFPSGDLVNPDDLLPPVVKLEKYATSNLVFNRQMVARNLLETLRIVMGNADEGARVVNILCNLSEDYEPSVRAELMQQIPHIAAFFNEYDYQPDHFIQQYIVPMIIKYLTDANNQVRKTCHSSMLLMVEQCLIDTVALETKICPRILQLTETSFMDDLRTEAVTLLSKLSPLIGKLVTERLFLDRYVILCLDSSFHVRKACADNFGEICTIVEKETTEKQLLPKFILLCEDSVWGVRKVCAEVFMPISCVCSMETRHKVLSPIYISLLCDQSRWVRMAAFQALGPFISTFAEPSKTGLYYNKFGFLEIDDSCVSLIPIKVKETSDSNGLGADSLSSCDNVVPPSDSSNDSDTQSTVNTFDDFRTVIEVNSVECDSGKSSPLANGSHNSEIEVNCDTKDNITNGISDLGEDGDQPVSLNPSCNPKEIVVCNGEIGDRCISSVQVESEAELSVTGGETVPNEIVVNGYPEPSASNESGVIVLPLPASMLETSFLDIEESVIVCEETTGEDTTSQTEDENDVNIPDVDVESIDREDSKSQESAFNHFQYWRMPLPTVDLDVINVELETTKSASVPRRCKKISCAGNRRVCLISQFYATMETNSEADEMHSEGQDNVLSKSSESQPSPPKEIDKEDCSKCSHCGTAVDDKYNQDLGESSILSISNMNSQATEDSFMYRDSYLDRFKDHSSSTDEARNTRTDHSDLSVHDQDIVPPDLLLRYLNMAEASKAQTVDAEIARHCAYSLPAVALTLGRRFWPCLKETCNILAFDLQGLIMQWKVRRTLASSMHQLAVILGPEITAEDLLPIFSGFIKDLDEVRIGILQNLSVFLSVLEMKDRKVCLTRLSDFLNTDNDKNWRFRHILSEQLISVATLYDPDDVREHLVPLALVLVRDKVSEVRMVAVKVLAVMIKTMSENSPLTKEVLSELSEQFLHSPKWLHRQLYVYICQEIVEQRSLLPEEFAEQALPHLLYLSWDQVANVRLAIARCIALVIWPLGEFSNSDSQYRELLLHSILPLQRDGDSDVRYFANMISTYETDLQDQAV